MYGIFLSEHNRREFGMSSPVYATVLNYATFGGSIVEAIHIPNAGLSLTGLVVDVDPSRWGDIDSLEGGYDRSIVTTTDGETVYMYTGKNA